MITASDDHMIWTSAGDDAFEHMALVHRLHLRVERHADGAWRATVARLGAPAGHILGFTTHATRRAAFDWCRSQIPGDTPTMHLITGD